MNQTTPSLYECLGRREGITRITADPTKNHLASPLVNARYLHSEDLVQVQSHVVEFFCAATGGPETYTGKAMVATHHSMNISKQEFMSVIDDMRDALQKTGIDDATLSEVLGVLWFMQREVLRVSPSPRWDFSLRSQALPEGAWVAPVVSLPDSHRRRRTANGRERESRAVPVS